MTNDSTRVISSPLGKIMMEGAEEIIGHSGIQTVFSRAVESRVLRDQKPLPEKWGVTSAELSSIQTALEDLYGPRGGRGVSLRAGRASFKYILRAYGQALGLTELAFRLKPAPARLKSGLESLAGWFSDLSGGTVAVDTANGIWFWRAERCPFCWLRHSSEPVCAYNVGLLQEFMAWASGGKVYQVQEVECLATGGTACVVRIEGKPLD